MASTTTASTPARKTKYLLWLILKNIFGWALILAALPAGLTIPGPGGLPLFVIGFAMITFPGKRALTSRVLRGLPMSQNSRRAIIWETVGAITLPAIIIWIFSIRFSEQMQRHGIAVVCTVYVLAVVAAGVILRLAMRAANYGLTFVPAARRKIRPWMRKKGIDLLPPRRRKRLTQKQDPSCATADDKGILEVDDRYQNKLKWFWKKSKPWLNRIISFGISAAIFIYMIRKVSMHWGDVRDRTGSISKINFAVAAVMFALFLFAVRAMSWRRIIKGFGHVLPIPAAVRIWSTSELARYVPGGFLQVYGRLHLARPYGVGGTECAASQILELIIFLLANILIGVTCLMIYGFRHVHGDARAWLIGLGASIPFLILLLYPPVFYSILDRVMHWRKKPPLAKRLTGFELFQLLIWAIVGLLWQNLAVFLIISGPLQLAWSKWYVVAGAYCIAWCAGFLIISAPGGLGVREYVLVITLSFVLPQSVKDQFSSTGSMKAFLTFLGAVLRLWTIAGELIVASLAYISDYRGALGRSPHQRKQTLVSSTT